MKQIDTRNTNTKKSNINVDNSLMHAEASGFGKIIWYISFILIIPLFIHIFKRNEIIRIQFNINELASGIEVQLKKRSDTLIKLVQATKSYIKYERGTLTEITKLRASKATPQAQYGRIEKISASIMAVAENYPDLKTNSLVVETMEQASYLEREIAASRRTYNSSVTKFNGMLYMYPINVITSSMKLKSFELFKTTEESKKDVSLDF